MTVFLKRGDVGWFTLKSSVTMSIKIAGCMMLQRLFTLSRGSPMALMIRRKQSEETNMTAKG
jgi:hypothetical protein